MAAAARAERGAEGGGVRRKRRTKYTWFPTLGDNQGEGATLYTKNAIRIPQTAGFSATGKPNILVFPLVPDFTEQTGIGAVAANPQLREIVEGQAWLLKRMVGKADLWLVGRGVGNPAQTYAFVQVTLGFFVARAADQSPSQVDMTSDEVDPMQRDNTMNPWIWRRTWILRNPQVTNIGTEFTDITIPSSTMQYGSVADGPHIDSKVSRRITREHRLFAAISVVGGDPNHVTATASDAQQPAVEGWLDLRILGAMRRNKNLSSF